MGRHRVPPSIASGSARALYLERILASVPDAVVTLDEAHRVVEWNPGAERLFGYSFAEAVGRELDDLVAPKGVPVDDQARELTSMLYRQHTIPYTESVRYTRDRTPVPVLFSGSPIIDQDRIVGFVVIYRDISERKRVQKEVEELLREKQILLTEAHHRIKNDLLLIRSMLSLQARRTKEPAAVAAIEAASGRLAAVGALYSELYSEGSEEVDLFTLLNRALGRLSGCNCRQSVDLDVERLTLPPRLAVAVSIIANELLTNAIKYSCGEGAGGGVEVFIRAASSDRLLMVVRDSGGGFPPAVLEGKERGLGLDIVSALAVQHGGELTLRNEGGAVAELSLPIPPL
ncbi:MAG: sensor histidine kinase [Alkalispirochaetaceae bacterium]